MDMNEFEQNQTIINYFSDVLEALKVGNECLVQLGKILINMENRLDSIENSIKRSNKAENNEN